MDVYNPANMQPKHQHSDYVLFINPPMSVHLAPNTLYRLYAKYEPLFSFPRQICISTNIFALSLGLSLDFFFYIEKQKHIYRKALN
ncbi:hypothetical protein XENTR_v10015642 [Xenopus tropicalis]|nr:hypothetical protein XENTR_v10015642 [Xenopus tropicalis]